MNATEAMHAVRRFINSLPPYAMDECWREVDALMTELEWDQESILAMFKNSDDEITTIPSWAENDTLAVAKDALTAISEMMPLSMSMVLDAEHGFGQSRAQVIKAKRIAQEALDKINQ